VSPDVRKSVFLCVPEVSHTKVTEQALSATLIPKIDIRLNDWYCIIYIDSRRMEARLVFQIQNGDGGNYMKSGILLQGKP
jgi:hypothetical protein